MIRGRRTQNALGVPFCIPAHRDTIPFFKGEGDRPLQPFRLVVGVLLSPLSSPLCNPLSFSSLLLSKYTQKNSIVFLPVYLMGIFYIYYTYSYRDGRIQYPPDRVWIGYQYPTDTHCKVCKVYIVYYIGIGVKGEGSSRQSVK